MKVFNIICCVVFVVSAVLQYNDEDPFIWIPLYGYGAWLCYLAARKRYLPMAYLLGITVYIGYAIYLLFVSREVAYWFGNHTALDLVQSMKAEQPWIEETREFGGLLMLSLALVINWIAAKKDRRSKQAAD